MAQERAIDVVRGVADLDREAEEQADAGRVGVAASDPRDTEFRKIRRGVLDAAAGREARDRPGEDGVDRGIGERECGEGREVGGGSRALGGEPRRVGDGDAVTAARAATRYSSTEPNAQRARVSAWLLLDPSRSAWSIPRSVQPSSVYTVTVRVPAAL